MGRVRVTFVMEPEEHEADPEHESGMSQAGYEGLVDSLMFMGADDIVVERVEESGGR